MCDLVQLLKDLMEHLETVEEVVPDDDDGAAARGPALAGGDGLDAGDGRGGVEPGVES